jgi:hypothetical protein
MFAKNLEKGDVLVATDNRKWTVDEIRHLRLGKKVEVLCHNGQNNRRFILNPDDPVILKNSVLG